MAEMHYQNIKTNQFNELTSDEYISLLADHEWEALMDIIEERHGINLR